MSNHPISGLKALFACGVALVAMAPAAYAQSAQPASAVDTLTADIVVTAGKKKNVENVQSVPTAITAFSQASLAAMQVKDLSSLSYSAPNVSLDSVGTTRGTANFSIRGLGVNSSIPSIEPTVGVMVDGVYMGINAGLVFDVFDLQSIEIARGPQGILYGRNTTGGAVLVNSGDPTSTLHANFKLSYDGPVDSGRGTGNVSAQAVISGPLIKDVLNFKVAGYTNYDGGYFKNLKDGADFGVAKTQIGRVALEYRASPNLRMVGKLEYFTSTGDGPAVQNHGVYSRRTFDFANDYAGYYQTKSWFGSHRTDLDLGNGRLTNIFGYRDYWSPSAIDLDGTANFIINSTNLVKQDQISDELRYNTRLGGLDLTVGGIWFKQHIKYDEARFTAASSLYGGGRQNHDSYGLFASGDYHVNDAIVLTAGVRWSRETKDAAVSYILPRAACSVAYGTCAISGAYSATQNNGFTDKHTWENWSPKFGAQYHFNRGSQIYASWTRGYRSGGYNFRIVNPAAFEAVAATQGFPFREEKVETAEIGFKFQTDDRKLTVNGAIFRTDIKDMQREVLQAAGVLGTSQSIYNTADARIDGVEGEARFAVTKGLLLTGNVGYLKGTYRNIKYDLSGDNVINAADYALDLPRTPEWTYGVGAVAELPLANGSSLSARANFQHRSKIVLIDSNLGWNRSANMLDGSLSWKLNGGVSLSVYGKNLLDEVQLGTDAQLPFGGALSTGVNVPFAENPKGGSFSPLTKGRVVGLEVAYQF